MIASRGLLKSASFITKIKEDINENTGGLPQALLHALFLQSRELKPHVFAGAEYLLYLLLPSALCLEMVKCCGDKVSLEPEMY